MPKVVLFKNETTGLLEYDTIEKYYDVSDSEKIITFKDLKTPELFYFGLNKDCILLDPSEEEFSVIESTAIITHFKGNINHIESIGASIDINKIKEMSDLVKNHLSVSS